MFGGLTTLGCCVVFAGTPNGGNCLRERRLAEKLLSWVSPADRANRSSGDGPSSNYEPRWLPRIYPLPTLLWPPWTSRRLRYCGADSTSTTKGGVLAKSRPYGPYTLRIDLGALVAARSCKTLGFGRHQRRQPALEGRRGLLVPGWSLPCRFARMATVHWPCH